MVSSGFIHSPLHGEQDKVSHQVPNDILIFIEVIPVRPVDFVVYACKKLNLSICLTENLYGVESIVSVLSVLRYQEVRHLLTDRVDGAFRLRV